MSENRWVPELAAVPLRAAAARGHPVVAGCVAPGPATHPLPGAAAMAGALGVDLRAELARVGATGRVGEVTAVPVADGARRVLLAVGVGDGSPSALRRAGAALARHRALGRAADHRGSMLLVPPSGVAAGGPRLRALAEGVGLGAYRVPRVGAAAAGSLRVAVAVRDPDTAADPLRRAGVVSAAVWAARDLANAPASVKSPQWLAAEVARLAHHSGCAVRVLDATELAAAGFGGVTAVGAGSVRPPCFVRLEYRPAGTGSAPHVVLVGKGVVFDSGGISLKPARGMALMKTDMAGAAAVAAVMGALRDLGVRVGVSALLPVAENAIGGSAVRPGDVVWPYGGRVSVEVLNTDAEGRLLLADALAYADLELDPDVVVDLATLTGAATHGLGRRDAPLYATDDRLAAALQRAAEAAGERVWRMPLVADYRRALDSTTADLANAVTDPAVGGGSITAALFLREFAGRRAWAHLDIAGTGRSDNDDLEVSKGATGFGVRLLLRWLEAISA